MEITAPTALLSTAYLPPIDYLSLLARHGRAAIDLGEHYEKQSYRNRCEIGTAQGRLPLVVPVKCPDGHRTPVGDVAVDYASSWQRVHLGAIRSAYAKSAYFIHYYDGLAEILTRRYERLHELNACLLRYLLDAFGVRIALEYWESYSPAERIDRRRETDYRAAIHPKKPRAGQYRYYQTFCDRLPFMLHLSSIDLLLNEGPQGLLDVMRQECPGPG